MTIVYVSFLLSNIAWNVYNHVHKAINYQHVYKHILQHNWHIYNVYGGDRMLEIVSFLQEQV